MIIECPECSAKFVVPIDDIGNGRNVRCAICNYKWYVENENFVIKVNEQSKNKTDNEQDYINANNEQTYNKSDNNKQSQNNIDNNKSRQEQSDFYNYQGSISKKKITKQTKKNNPNEDFEEEINEDLFLPIVWTKFKFPIYKLFFISLLSIILFLAYILNNRDELVRTESFPSYLLSLIGVVDFSNVVVEGYSVDKSLRGNAADVTVKAKIINKNDHQSFSPILKISAYSNDGKLLREEYFSLGKEKLAKNEEFNLSTELINLPNNVDRIVVDIGSKLDLILR